LGVGKNEKKLKGGKPPRVLGLHWSGNYREKGWIAKGGKIDRVKRTGWETFDGIET